MKRERNQKKKKMFTIKSAQTVRNKMGQGVAEKALGRGSSIIS